MKTDKLLLIINPISGVRSKEGMDVFLSKKLSALGFDVDTEYTKAPGHATELAQEAVKNGIPSVAVCGGDGTINEVANALCGTDVKMGIIPSGSGNGLARHLGIPVDEEASLKTIAARRTVLCDCGKANGQLFFCTFGMGFDATVSMRFANESKRGRMTYIKNVVEEFGHYHPLHYRITIDGRTFEEDAFIVACCNASQYGNNAFIAPQACITDGLLDVVVVKCRNTFQTLMAGWDVMTGMVPYNHNIDTYRGRYILIEAPDSPYAHIDGEPVMAESPIELSCLPGQLHIYADPVDHHITPYLTPLSMTLHDWGLAVGNLFK